MTIESFHCDEPFWLPLESTLLQEECSYFMYMGWLEVDGQRVHHYKHIITRRYLFLNEDLKAYRYVGDEIYVPQSIKPAIRYVFELPEPANAGRRSSSQGMLAYHEEDNGQASR